MRALERLEPNLFWPHMPYGEKDDGFRPTKGNKHKDCLGQEEKVQQWCAFENLGKNGRCEDE